MTKEGVMLHAKHAYMPNSLGYCGPDDRGRILRHLEGSSGGGRLVTTLKEFEAAYPFLRLIARSSGLDPFDYSVPEAYWIGNGLLDLVEEPDFYAFTHRELRGRDKSEVKKAFSALNGAARPHHSFYVMSTYAGAGVRDGRRVGVDRDYKVGKMIDDCRVAWGEVKKVGANRLTVEYKPVVLSQGTLSLSSPAVKEVLYNREVRPFGKVKPGDVVSLHWGYACELLNARQRRNIAKFTAQDIASANRLLARLQV